ncbi:Holliday junction branch migration protein RuvA [Peptococcaceae bacterium]|nr:Holliday junction branch migration protein RuvA [Peptococcaceae bacterium]
MIAFLRGKLAFVEGQTLTLDVNGVGYSLLVPTSVTVKLPEIGEEIFIYTYLVLRDDNVQLYGFLSKEELFLFTKMLGVSGIGPKNALSVISTYDPDEISCIVVNKDTAALSKVPGVGRKTADRIILELKDKLKTDRIILELKDKLKTIDKKVAGKKLSEHYIENSAAGEAIEGLKVLGYSNKEAKEAVYKAIEAEELNDTAELIKKALKYLA